MSNLTTVLQYQEIAVVKAAKDREPSTLLLVADEVVYGSSYHLRIHQLTAFCQSQRCSHSWCQKWPEMLCNFCYNIHASNTREQSELYNIIIHLNNSSLILHSDIHGLEASSRNLLVKAVSHRLQSPWLQILKHPALCR